MQDTRSTRNVWDDEPEAGFAGGDEFAGHSRSQAQTGQGAVPQNFEEAEGDPSVDVLLLARSSKGAHAADRGAMDTVTGEAIDEYNAACEDTPESQISRTCALLRDGKIEGPREASVRRDDIEWLDVPFAPLVVLEMAQGMARVDHTATYELCDTGLRLAPKLRARVIVCYSTAMRHYCIVWRDAAGGWWIMDDMIGGAVAREIEDEDVADWCRPQDSGWSPVFVIYARVY